jgi:hypothetical protein
MQPMVESAATKASMTDTLHQGSPNQTSAITNAGGGSDPQEPDAGRRSPKPQDVTVIVRHNPRSAAGIR